MVDVCGIHWGGGESSVCDLLRGIADVITHILKTQSEESLLSLSLFTFLFLSLFLSLFPLFSLFSLYLLSPFSLSLSLSLFFLSLT